MIDGLEHFGWDDLIYLLLIPVAVVIILMVHELGHYLMARLYGIKIKAVEFGAGPALWSRTDKHGTRWTLYLYPAFAHVHLAGFEEADDDRRSFQSAGPLQKITTILAGPAANLILPFFLLFAFYMAFGQPAQKPVVTGIEIGQAGERAGLQYGDEVTAINGRPVSRFKDIDRMTYDRPDQDLVQIFTIRRDGRTMEITVKPDWVEYKDADGIPRAHNRLGVIWHSQPFDFDALRTIGGQDVKDQPKRIRRLVTENLDREMTLGFYATDGNVRNYKTIPQSTANDNLNNKGHEDYTALYLGPTKYNHYLAYGVHENLRDALWLTGDLIAKIAALPFQLLPIDPELKDGLLRMNDPATAGRNLLYRLICLTSLLSVALGMINLLPLPKLDGAHILFILAEAANRRPLTPRQKAWILSGAFLIFYLSVLFANMDNVPTYIDSRAKKVQEFINDKTEE